MQLQHELKVMLKNESSRHQRKLNKDKEKYAHNHRIDWKISANNLFIPLSFTFSLQFSYVFEIEHVDGDHMGDGRNLVFCITRQPIFSPHGHMELCTRCADLCPIRTETSSIQIDSEALELLH